VQVQQQQGGIVVVVRTLHVLVRRLTEGELSAVTIVCTQFKLPFL
jgi:hypothetical protein